MSTVGYGDVVPKKGVSNALAAMIIFSGIVLFGVAVASFSSALTVQNLQSEIAGPDDLKGRRVAVIADTTSATAAQKRGAKLVLATSVNEAAALVRDGKADAAVHDVPLLQHYVKEHPEQQLTVMEATFDPSIYGITFPNGSPLRRDVNVVLLELMSEPSGFNAMTQQKWFGTPAE